MGDIFEGIPPVTFDFLRDLQQNNNKEWFEHHKSDYQDYVLKPLQALVAGLAPFMLTIDQDLEVTPALNKTISRIYRDTRFSRDKSPYKTSHWITFKRLRKEWQDFPAYFFEISPDSYRFGMGFYSASRDTMNIFRQGINADPQRFLSAVSFFAQQKTFSIEGEQYKRPLQTDLPTELSPWYNRKNIYLVCNRRIEGNEIDRGLSNELTQHFAMISPLYHYFSKVALRARQAPAKHWS